MPEHARVMGISGAVVVSYTVSAAGQVGSIELLNPSAPPVLVDAVRQWLTSCPFEPALVAGSPTPVRVERQPFVFRLR